MKPENGDQFAASAGLIENKALRVGETNSANRDQAIRFARTDEERRAIQLGALKAKQRDLEATDRQDGVDPSDEAEPTTEATEDVPCSD